MLSTDDEMIAWILAQIYVLLEGWLGKHPFTHLYCRSGALGVLLVAVGVSYSVDGPISPPAAVGQIQERHCDCALAGHT